MFIKIQKFKTFNFFLSMALKPRRQKIFRTIICILQPMERFQQYQDQPQADMPERVLSAHPVTGKRFQKRRQKFLN